MSLQRCFLEPFVPVFDRHFDDCCRFVIHGLLEGGNSTTEPRVLCIRSRLTQGSLPLVTCTPEAQDESTLLIGCQGDFVCLTGRWHLDLCLALQAPCSFVRVVAAGSCPQERNCFLVLCLCVRALTRCCDSGGEKLEITWRRVLTSNCTPPALGIRW